MCPHAALLGGRKRQFRCEPGGPHPGVQIHTSQLPLEHWPKKKAITNEHVHERGGCGGVVPT